jgi:hypothetical protein
MSNVLIVGMGEIGKSLKEVYSKNESFNIYEKDIACPEEDVPEIDVMNICFGYSKTFEKDVINYIKFYKPRLTIIHSTVPMLTTRIIYDNTKVKIVHSSVTGKHPNLTKSLLTFKKPVGGIEDDAVEIAMIHLTEMNITPVKFKNAETSEIAKLFCTTRLGLDVYYMNQVHLVCNEYGLDFNQVYTESTKNYNDGYTKLGNPEYTRPVLKYMGDGLSGHCVWENSKILYARKILKNIAKLIVSLGKKK